MDLPQTFIQNIHVAFGERGRDWLIALPALIEEISKRWGLVDVQSVPNLSYNFVAFAKQGGEDVMLKIGVPNRELTSEMHALRLFNGAGACRLLDYDEEKGFLLIERLKPGTMLADMEDDEKRTHVAIDVMQGLWMSHIKTSGANFIQLKDWFAGLNEIRLGFNGGVGPFPKKIFERVESSLPELLAGDDICLMHGDFHHYNILLSDRGWLAIDPKGVVGPVGYEIGPLMVNPWMKPMDRSLFKVQTVRRLGILHERLGWPRELILDWSLAHAVLSAWWDYPAGDWNSGLQCADVFMEVR